MEQAMSNNADIQPCRMTSCRTGAMLIRMLPVVMMLAIVPPVSASDAKKKEAALQQAAEQLVADHLKSVGKRSRQQFYPADQWDLRDLPEYRPERRLSGTIRIGKAKYLRLSSVMEQWEHEFRKFHPGVAFEHSQHDLVTGLVDIVQQRGYTFAEWQQSQLVQGRYPLEIEMSTGAYNVPGYTPAFAIFVNKGNPIQGLSIDQLDGIFGGARSGGFNRHVWSSAPARGRDKNIRTWDQLGLRGKEWVGQEINVNGRPLKYHIQLYFERKVFDGGSIWNENKREWAHELQPDGTRALSSVSMVGAVGADKYGIVYADLNSNIPEVKYLPIAPRGSTRYVELTLDNVRERRYPLFLENYLYVQQDKDGNVSPVVTEFLRYVLSRQGQQAIQNDGKWLPLTAEVVKAQLDKFDRGDTDGA